MIAAAAAGLDADVRLRLGDLDLAAHLQVAPNETVAVLGPNGAGKTTLLRAIAGLLRVDAGGIVLDGNALDDPAAATFVDPENRSVAVVFQDYLLFPHLSVVDNVAFGLRCRGTRAKEARQKAIEWLQRVGLHDHASANPTTKPSELSGGQAQRVALARALVTSPRVLLLDEPLAALDAATRATTRRELARHLREHDGVRVVVTHDPVEAAALADRLVVLERGRVVQEGTLAELTAHPRSRYVAELVGTNLLAGHAANGTVTVAEGVTLTIADTDAEGDALAVIPPHAVALHRRAPEGTPRNVWQATVVAIDQGQGHGDGQGRARVLLSPPLAIVAEVTATAVGELGLAEGTPVWASVKATEITAFPA